LDFESATKAGLERNMRYSASVSSLLRWVLLSFQLLGLSRASRRHDEDSETSDAFQAQAIQFKEANASQSNGGGSFKLILDVNVQVASIVM
jgi:hypothetical protein